MKPELWSTKSLKKVTVVRCSIWLVFLTFLTILAVHWSGHQEGFGSGRAIYRVNISTGDITVEGTQVVSRK